MIFDAIRRFLGLENRPPRWDSTRRPDDPSHFRPFQGEEVPPNSQSLNPVDIFDMDSDIQNIHRFMDQQMRSVMGSFEIFFGGPGIQHDPRAEENLPFDDRPPQFDKIFPFMFGVPSLPDIPDRGNRGEKNSPFGVPLPPLPGSERNLDPRDEVLKPHFRNQSHNQTKDENLDDLVQHQGPGVVVDMMKPNHRDGGNFFPKTFSWLLDGTKDQHIASTITVYQNINGHSTYEKIVRHPDGSVDRTVIENDGKSSQPEPFQPIE